MEKQSESGPEEALQKRGGRKGRFYEAALSEVQRLMLPEARELEGLDEEIAVLRVKFLTSLQEEPQNHELHLKEAATLVRAVATRYKLGSKARKDLYESVDAVLKNLGLPLGVGRGEG